MATKPDLRPVPYENRSYFRLKDKKLIVVVKNFGSAPAKATTTQVDFHGFGSREHPENRQPQKRLTKALKPGESDTLEFECPSDAFFDSDGAFYITVDANNEFREDPTARNNVTRGACRKPMHPDLGVVLNDKGALGTLENGELKVVVQNQGTAYAGPSKTRVNLVDIGEYDVPTDGLEPGYSTNVIVQQLYANGKLSKGAPLKCKISLDIDEVVHVANDNKKLAPRVFEGSIAMTSQPSK